MGHRLQLTMVIFELNNKGFTLVEMLIVLGLVIVMFTIVTVGMQNTYIRIQVHHELYSLSQYISSFKHESIHLKEQVKFVLDNQSIYVHDERLTTFNTLTFDGRHTYTYHPNGNISSFNTVGIDTPLKRYSLVFHIGSGHHEIR